MSSLPKGWLTRDSRRLPAVRARGGKEEHILPLGWEERLHLPHGWMGSRSTGWEEHRAFPGDGEPGTVNGGRSRTYHWDGWADIFCSRRRCSAEANQQGAVQRLGLPSGYSKTQSCRTKIQLMMKRIKINSPAMWLSKTMMEMKRNKTAEEPKKQNAGARKRVTLKEEDRVKMDRWMTKPGHKGWTMFTKHPHVVHSPCHPCTVSLVHHVTNSPSWSTPSINHAIHSPFHQFNMSSIHHVIRTPCHPFAMSSI